MIENVLAWGRQNYTGNGSVKDLDGHFDRAEVEKWRKELRRQYLDGNRQIEHSYRQGYEVTLNDYEAIGLTNGYGPGFVVYYRRRPNAKN